MLQYPSIPVCFFVPGQVPAPTIISIIVIINISTISLIHTSSINDIQENIIMIRYNDRAVVRIIFMFSIPLGLLVWMRLMILMLMMMMILLMVGAGTCILPKFPAAAVNIFCA